jgi:hypothetical protein
MLRRFRVAVVTVVLVASGVAVGTASADASSGLPSGAQAAPGKPSPSAPSKLEESKLEQSKPEQSKPDRPPGSDEKFRKRKLHELGKRKPRQGLSDAQLAHLARGLGVSESRLISALSTAKKAVGEKGKTPGDRVTPAIVAAFAHELGISPIRARKVLEFVFEPPAEKEAKKPKN